MAFGVSWRPFPRLSGASRTRSIAFLLRIIFLRGFAPEIRDKCKPLAGTGPHLRSVPAPPLLAFQQRKSRFSWVQENHPEQLNLLAVSIAGFRLFSPLPLWPRGPQRGPLACEWGRDGKQERPSTSLPHRHKCRGAEQKAERGRPGDRLNQEAPESPPPLCRSWNRSTTMPSAEAPTTLAI